MVLYIRAAICFLSRRFLYVQPQSGPASVNPLCLQQGEPPHDECDLTGNQLSLAASRRGDRWAGDCSQPCPTKVPLSGKVIAVVAFAPVRW